MKNSIKESYEKLLASKEFKHKGFLCGAFLICDIEDINNTEWQIDFYNTESDTITTYLVSKKIEITDNSKILKKEDVKIEKLNINEIKTSFEDIKNKIENILNKYKETAAKITVILQKQKIPMWNIIYITKKFNILNIKINAENGEVIEEKTVPLVSFERGGVKN
ncbi:hypothetical protein J4230_01525 [Candidatus Woesearchaeota archaeon]|nr:hypothetical protein [Candidatus Woesearchaeota archaeon]